MDVELLHGSYQGFYTIKHVLVDCESVQAKFLVGVAVLMDDLHLLDNCRFAAFPGS